MHTNELHRKMEEYNKFMKEAWATEMILSDPEDVISQSEEMVKFLFKLAKEQKTKIECLEGKIAELQRSEPRFQY